MEISIVIVNYKTPKLIKKCVESIKKFPPKVPFEIIVEDNSKDNLGFAMANNNGIKKAKGKYILLLNSDTEVTDGAINKLYDFAKKTINIGGVVPQLLNNDRTVQPSVYKLPTISGAINQYWFGGKELLDKYSPNISVEVEAAVMACFLITPRAIKQVGLLNEKYFFYFEDLDYCKRIKEKGLKTYFLKEAKVIHVHGASGGTNKLLIEASKKYFGLIRYYIYTFVLWSGQKWQKILRVSEKP